MTFIKSLKSDKNIILKKCATPAPEILITDPECVHIAIVDTETTGIDKLNDKIIEIAIKSIDMDKSSGKILSIKDQYESYNDPGVEIKNEITLLTGIDNSTVFKSSINWDTVDFIFEKVDLIIAHNAAFDRAFIDPHSSKSKEKVWACSVNDIDWLNRGFSSSKQELLCHWHGFYFEAHRAMNDVDALLTLLTHNSYITKRPILELLENAWKPTYIIFAENFVYDIQKKDIMKANKYNWNPIKKIWFKIVSSEQIDIEKKWLTELIYGTEFKGRIEKVNIIEKYKI